MLTSNWSDKHTQFLFVGIAMILMLLVISVVVGFGA